MTAPEATQMQRMTARAGIAIAALTTYARGLGQPLVESWDDGRFLVEFEPVQKVSLDSLIRIFGEIHFQAWHPLHLLSYWIDVPWFGPSGPVLHTTNLILWVAALLLLLHLFERLGLPLWAAALGTLAYGLHPVQLEAVTWATGRKEILALLLSSAAILLHLRSERLMDRAAWGSRGLFVLAAMAKTTVLPLPGLLFLIDVLLRDVPWKAAVRRQLPALAIGAGFSLVVIHIWRTHEMIRPDTGGASAVGNLALVAATYTHQLRTAFWPAGNAPVYPINRTGEFAATAFVGPLLILGGIALTLRAKAGRGAFAIAGFALLLLPTSNLIPVYFQYQDRYLSLPLLPLAFGFGAIVAAARNRAAADRRKASVLTAVAAALIIALAARNIQYQEAWSSDQRLWEHTVSTHPSAFYAWMKLGELRRDEGHFDAAIAAYDKAIEAAPDLRLGYGGRFYVVALRDEQKHDITPSQALELSGRFVAAADDPTGLRDMASEMAASGYREAMLLCLGRSMDLSPVDDDRLESAAAVQFQRGNLWLARFYVSRMSREPLVRQLTEL